jgi:hypothetical protein
VLTAVPESHQFHHMAAVFMYWKGVAFLESRVTAGVVGLSSCSDVQCLHNCRSSVVCIRQA